MIRKTLAAAVAALTLAGAVTTTTSSAQAGWRGAAIAAGVLGVAAGAIASQARPAYAVPVYGEPAYPYGGCGYERRPVFDENGYQVGWRRVPVC
ncbi:putative exported protein of unknown function [Methylobacterium sp. 4-46]|uniref:hypothetical protein n=1 Tax=unclassified Methylobacterium TaxID=2615210 RepID=UPI000165CDDD|nr:MULTISPECIES: hypothetical protein [Methylobacterium]ACA20136.1 putative exported protein of unknown function [Methylobacterium sp. 4-46]WFT79316.1 hypothetical protein QA634_29520 [Methylobacterium nodulans]